MNEATDDFRAEVRDWLAANLPPPPDFALPESMLGVSTTEQRDYLQDWQRRVYDAGYVGVEWPEAYGGRGGPAGFQRIVDQEMSRAGAPFLLNLVGLSWAGPIILHAGSEAQKRRYLPKLLSGDELWCQGFSEPGAGSDLASLRTSALRDGDAYRIEGHKVWTSLAHFAHHMILLARTDPDAGKHAGISYFLAPMDVPGITVEPLVKLTGEGGFNQVIFSGARIPADTLLGNEGEGWRLAVQTLSFERGASEGSAGGRIQGGVGGVASLIAMARGRVRDGVPLLDDPVVRDRIARFAIEEAAMRGCMARMRVPDLNVDRPLALPLMMKVVGSEFAQQLSDFGAEIQGAAAGLWTDDPGAVAQAAWQHGYLNSFGSTIAGGTSEIVRNVLGEKVLGLPKTR